MFYLNNPRKEFESYSQLTGISFLLALEATNHDTQSDDFSGDTITAITDDWISQSAVYEKNWYIPTKNRLLLCLYPSITSNSCGWFKKKHDGSS